MLEEIVYSVFLIIWVIIGVVAMEFAFKLDYKNLKDTSWPRRLFWWYGFCFMWLVTLISISGFILFLFKG